VLDAGCGDGFLGERLMKEKGCTVTGMDVSSVALASARQRKDWKLFRILDQPLVFADNSFDYAIASESIEHIAQSEAALKELYRVARPGSLFRFPIPDIGNTAGNY